MESKPRWTGIAIMVIAILTLYVGSYLSLTTRSRIAHPGAGPGDTPLTLRFSRYHWMSGWMLHAYGPLAALEGQLTGEEVHSVYSW